MKLITKIYLSIGLILLFFVFVTLAYFNQSDKVEKTVEEVLLSSEIIQNNSEIEVAIISAQTGLRGYLLSGKENFLEPYYAGIAEYLIEANILKTLNKNKPANLNYLKEIDDEFNLWNDSIAQPIILAKRNADLNPVARQTYDKLFDYSYNQEVGKARIDTIRHFTQLIETGETKNKNILALKLKQSQKYVGFLGFGLTGGALVFGLITAFFLGNIIKKRITSMKKLAGNLAKENFDQVISDDYQDELSSLSEDMNAMAQKLNNSFKTLKKMNQELDQFAYVVSHDLKAPLRAINNLAEWIDEDIGETTPEIRHNLSLMRGRVHRLENLINGILAYARIGRTKIQKTTFDIGDLLREIVDSLSLPVGFQVFLPSQKQLIFTEKILLHQVLVNLISNAIKYNKKPDGWVKVEVERQQKSYLITVADNGPGIPVEYHEKIFGVFQTIEARDTVESTGIGLAIVKKIIEEKDGYIQVASEVQKGAVFTFSWPGSQPETINQNETVLTHD